MTPEVTRLGMGAAEMEVVADLMAAVLVERRDPAEVRRQSVDLRAAFQQVQYCFAASQPVT